MKKKHLNFLLASLFPFLVLSYTYSQETTKNELPLIEYLEVLEKDFNVKFSYADSDLIEIVLARPDLKNFEKILQFITDKTGLTFSKLNNRYFAIDRADTISICAYILDNFQKNTIPGATVEILDNEKATVTDSNGKFVFSDIPKSATVLIKHIGFKSLFINASELGNANNCREIPMALQYQELDEVIVSKFLTTGLSKLNNSSFEILPSKFGILPGLSEPDVLQTIQALPGIKSIDETVSDINIRGGTNDQNLILWDGIKMYQTGHFFGLISAFNPYVTKKVTVIKNGTSAALGGGVSGTLDMETQDYVSNDFNGGLGFNLIAAHAFAYVPINDNLGIQVSARRSHTDFLNSPTYTTFSEKAFQDTQVESEKDFYFYDFTAKLVYEIDPYQKFSFSLIHMSNNLDYLETNQQDNIANRSNLNQDNIAFGGSWSNEWADNFTTDFSLYYTQYNLNATTISNDRTQQLLQKNLVKESNVKINTLYKLSNRFHWTNGYDFTETGIENSTDINQPQFTSNIKGVIRNHSIYSEIGYSTANGKLDGRIGGRLNYFENVNTFQKVIMEPRLNFSYEFAPHIKTEILGEFKSQATNQIIDLEQNFFGIEKRRWILANETNLPITRSKQGSVGVNYDANRIYLGVEGFYKRVNGINIYTQGFQNQNQFDGELGSYDIHGLEFLINLKNNVYSAWASYTYNKNDYTFEALNPSTFPNNSDIRHSFTLAGNYTLGNFKIGAGINYKSGKPITEPQEDNPINTSVFPNEINYQESNSSRLAEYIRIDASANYDFKLSKTIQANLGASVLNLSDRKNTLNTYYRLRPDNTIETVERKSLGLTPNASFRIQF